MTEDNTCANPICGCPGSDQAAYCSDHCKDVVDQDIVEISCDCGHPECG